MESEKTNLELLEEQHAALVDEIRTMDQKALRLMSAVEGNKPTEPFDPLRHRQHREKLKRQLPILETKVRRERDRFLKERRAQKQRELQDLQPELNVTKCAYHEAQKALEEAWKCHALLEAQAWNLEQQLTIDFESMRENQRALQRLIREITGVDENNKRIQTIY